MDRSEAINELAAALSKAQDQMGGAAKDSNNPFFKSKYSDLSDVVKAIKQPFADNDLSFTQFPLFENGHAGVETMLMHSSGQYMSSVLLLPVGAKMDAQATGSAITYARRYSLQAIAGVPSEDDDGNSAAKATKIKPVASADLVGAIQRNQDSLIAINQAVDSEDFPSAVQCYDEMSQTDINILWQPSPTECKKMGIEPVFTTKAKKFLLEEASKYR